MYIFLMVIHVFVCLFLIFVILLQAGRGSGMSDMMGAAQPQSLFGTQTNVFMTRITEICAVLFIVTSLSLGILTTQRGKSLVERGRALRDLKHTVAAALPETGEPTAAASGATQESTAPSAS